MHTKGPKEDPLVDLGYEIRDVDTTAIQKAVMWFFTFATAMFIIGAWIYANINPAFSPSYQAQKEKLIIPQPPNPLLQTGSTNVTDIMHLRQAETAALTSTGYTDASRQFAHIPIETAIGIIAKEGIAPTGASVPAVSKGNTTDEVKDSAPDAASSQFATALAGSTVPSNSEVPTYKPPTSGGPGQPVPNFQPPRGLGN